MCKIMAISLVEYRGNKRKERRFYDSEIVIGRDRSCDLVVPGNNVSGKHCEVVCHNTHHVEGLYALRDLDTEHGTFLRGEKLRYETPLRNDDKIKIGDRTFKVRIE